MTAQEARQAASKSERRKERHLARERGARRRLASSALLRKALRRARARQERRQTVTQITVRLTQTEDRALAGLLERGVYVSVTEAIRAMIREAAEKERAT